MYYINSIEVLYMSEKLLSKLELQKRAKINKEKLNYLINQKILEDNEIYTEADLDSIKEFRKSYPLDLNEVSKRYKLNKEQIENFKLHGLINGTQYFSKSDIEIFQSWQKLKRLGYNDNASLKVLNEVGIPKENNLFDDKSLIQLKELSETVGLPERTIKFYEKQNLIQKPEIYKNKRFYQTKIIDNLLLIRDMQQIGYKLSNISEFLNTIKTADKKTIAVKSIKQEINKKISIANTILSKLEAI